MAPMYQEGDRLRIIGGLYKHHKTAIYVGPYGKNGKMVTVRVNGVLRNIWRTSVEKEENHQENSTGGLTKIVLDRKEYDDLLQEISRLSNSIESLQLKVKSYGT